MGRTRSFTAVDLPSEERGGKPAYDDDFKAGYAAGQAAYKKDDSVSGVDGEKAYKRVSKKHGSWWEEGYSAAIDMARGATKTQVAQIAKKMKLGSTTRSAAIRRAYTLPKGSPKRRKLLARARQAGGLGDLDSRKWYISTEDGDTYGPYSSETQAGDDGDAAFRGTTEFIVERGDKVRDSILDPRNFGLYSPRELLKTASRVAGQFTPTKKDPLDLSVMLLIAEALGRSVKEADSMNITLDDAIVSVRVGSKVSIKVREMGSDDSIFTKDYSWNTSAASIAKDIQNAL